MNDETAKPEDIKSAPEAEVKAAEAPKAEAPGPDPVDVLKSENAELRDRLLRTIAEMENLRKRLEREKAVARAARQQPAAQEQEAEDGE